MPVSRLSLVCLLVAIGGLPLNVQGQASDSLGQGADSTNEGGSTVAQRVAVAFTKGDAGRLLTPSADRVEISIFGVRTFYSSAQALYVLREFFRRHAPQRFRVWDVMKTETNCFVRGQYEQSSRARQLRIYVRLEQPKEGELWYLHEVRIENSSE